MSLFLLLKRGEIVENIVMGILAHVDAGKTTLSEGMLYLSGTVRKLGRVDHKDAFLDTYFLERDRGITIFSKQAVFSLGNRRINLLDTPGHVDFSAEMERTLQVLDYAVLVISGADGVQGHTETLWKLLKLYEIPTFIFINNDTVRTFINRNLRFIIFKANVADTKLLGKILQRAVSIFFTRCTFSAMSRKH